MNKIKPTKRQRKAFGNINRGMTKRQAMLEAGYSNNTSLNPKLNLMDSRGYQELVIEYRNHLEKAGVSLEILADIQAEGLFDQDSRVRLEYLKETKRDLGLREEKPVNLQTFNSGGEMSLEFVLDEK